MSFVDDLIAYENGELSALQSLELFAHLIKTGQAWSLQGTYGRVAAQMISAGWITDEGVITDEAIARLAEYDEEPTEEPDECDDCESSAQPVFVRGDMGDAVLCSDCISKRLKPEVDPHNDWGISQQRIEEHFAAEAATKLATNGDRTYLVGIPLAVTVKGNGEIVLDFDLCEAYEFEPCDEGADQGVLRDDSNAVSHRLTRIRNHHRLTLPVPALKEIS